jgi:dynein light intermediate chain, axonemal
MDIIEKWDAEQRITDDKRRKEELDFLKYQGQHLDSFLKQMNSAK